MSVLEAAASLSASSLSGLKGPVISSPVKRQLHLQSCFSRAKASARSFDSVCHAGAAWGGLACHMAAAGGPKGRLSLSRRSRGETHGL